MNTCGKTNNMNNKKKSASLAEVPTSPANTAVSDEEAKSSRGGDNLWGIRNL
jgi:hypothetical protein